MKCKYCGGDIEIRNPTGKCDHLYYPDYCEGYKEEQKKVREEKLKKLIDDCAKQGITPEQVAFVIAQVDELVEKEFRELIYETNKTTNRETT